MQEKNPENSESILFQHSNVSNQNKDAYECNQPENRKQNKIIIQPFRLHHKYHGSNSNSHKDTKDQHGWCKQKSNTLFSNQRNTGYQ